MCSRPRISFSGWKIALQRRDPLAHVLGQIADPLEVGRDPHRADDLAQVDRHWLAPGDGQYRAFLDHVLQAVDFGIGGHHMLAQRDVATDQRVDGFDDHALGKTAHLGDQPGQFLQVAVERLGGMFSSHVSLRIDAAVGPFSSASTHSNENVRTGPHASRTGR